MTDEMVIVSLIERDANDSFERFALLFEFTGDAKAIRHVVNDMFMESSRDKIDWKEEASQADMDRF